MKQLHAHPTALFVLLALAACSDAANNDSVSSTANPLASILPPDDSNGGGGQPEPVDVDPGGAWKPPVETGAVAFPYTAYKCGYAVREVSPSHPATVFHGAAAGAAPTPKNLHLTIPGNSSSSVAFSWVTDSATMQTEVRFGDSPTNLDKVAHGFSFATQSQRRQHELHLCGLKPNSTIYYDAGGPAGRSTVHKVTTAPDAATEVTLLVVGDARSTPAVFGQMAAAAMAQGPTAFLFSGDAVADGNSVANWDALFAAAPDLFAELPGIWANGNHEGLAELYFHQFALPDHRGGTTQIEQWYASTYGPLRAIVLNDTVSNASQIGGSEKDFLTAELRAVDRSRTPFVLTLHHKPMYTTSSAHGSEMNLRSTWGPLMAQYKVNLDVTGHVHLYESTKPLAAGTTNVTGETAGTRFFVFGGGGAPLYDFTTNQPWSQKRESTNGFAILKVTPTTTTWTGFRKDGSTIETVVMPARLAAAP